MSVLKPPQPVKPLVVIFSAEPDLLVESARRLEDVLGRLDYISELIHFDQTQYYRDEMGWPLYKRILAAETLIDPARLPQVKEECVRIERERLRSENRRVNIDPGYIAAQHLVLATGKSAGHRVYLDRGVWADLTLLYENRAFKALAWTYPDYVDPQVQAALIDVRKKYLHQLKVLAQEKK